jgi:hypothetical protein
MKEPIIAITILTKITVAPDAYRSQISFFIAYLSIILIFNLFFVRLVLVVVNNVDDIQLELHILIFYFLLILFNVLYQLMYLP